MRFRRVLTLLSGLLLVACGRSSPPVLVDEPPAEPFVRLARVGTPSWSGDLVQAQPGDWLLRNEHFTVVVAAPHRFLGDYPVGGCLIDAFTPEGGGDALRILEPMGDGDSLRTVYTELDSVSVGGADARVELIARGFLADRDDVRVATRYRLLAGSPVLDIETTLIVQDGAPLRIVPADRVDWGRATALSAASREAHGGAGAAWISAADPSTAYLWAGEGVRAVADSGSITVASWNPVTVSPRDTLTVRRRFAVAHGSHAEVLRAVPDLVSRHGRITVEVRDDSGHPVHNALVEARDASGRALLAGETNQSGLSLLTVPPGSVTIVAFHPSRGESRSRPVSLGPEAEERVRLTLPVPATLRLVSRTESGAAPAVVAARWLLRGLQGTPDPVLGRWYETTDGGSGVFADGERIVEVPPGRYSVVARSAAWRTDYATEIRLEAGEVRRLTASAPDWPMPAGWVAVDLHGHSPATMGCVTGIADRNAASAALGVDVSVATDRLLDGWPGERSSPPHGAGLHGIELVGARGYRWAVVGSTSPAPPPATVSDPIQELLERNSVIGFLSVFSDACVLRGVDAAAAGPWRSSEAESLLSAADVWELWTGSDVRRFEEKWETWMSMLASRTAPVVVGASGAFALPEAEDRFPRTWLRAPSEDPEGMLDALRRGRAQVSSGPFIELDVAGAAPGDTARVSADSVAVFVRVTAPDWVQVDRVTVVVTGREEMTFAVRETESTVRFEESLHLALGRSGFVVVRVEGGRPLDRTRQRLPAEASAGRQPSLAFTNPVWVEISATPR